MVFVKLPGLTLLLCTCAATFAAAPDAGQLLREQPQTSETKLQPSAATPGTAENVARKIGGPSVLVRSFRFTGYEGLATEAELQAAVQGLAGRTLSVAELQDATARVTAFLRQKGFLLARAYLPKQDVTAGAVQIDVVQAKVDGTVGVRRSQGSRIDEGFLQSIAARTVTAGEALQEQSLDHTLMIINDLPGVMGRVLLEQGTAPGTTRVAVDVTEGNLFSGSVWADNFGNRYTGTYRGNGLFSLNDLSGRGDQFSLLLSGAEDLRQGRATYTAPLGSSGLKGNLSASLLDYDIGKEFSVLKMEGRALTLNGWFTYPLVLRRNQGVSASAGYEFKALNDKMLGFKTKDRRLQSGSLGLNGYSRDRFGGGGYTAWSVTATFGTLDLDRVALDKLADALGPRADGSFARFNFSLSRLQQLPAGFTFSAAYFGQLATTNLNSSERFSLGGPYGVRAYPVGDGSGDEGHQFNFEFRRDLPLDPAWGSLQLIAFYDAGTVRLNKERWAGDVTTATGKNSYWLSGAGLGANYAWNNRFSLRLSYAWQIDRNPGRDRLGHNVDGRSDHGCLWATAQYRF